MVEVGVHENYYKADEWKTRRTCALLSTVRKGTLSSLSSRGKQQYFNFMTTTTTMMIIIIIIIMIITTSMTKIIHFIFCFIP